MTFTEKVHELEALRTEAISYILLMNRHKLKRFLAERRKQYGPSHAPPNDHADGSSVSHEEN
jgi:hypothetical protein